MTRLIIVLLIFSILVSAEAQSFIRVGGKVSSTVSDSRSVNFVDLNNDGWDDLVVTNGLQGGQADLLYLNDGSGNMVEVTGVPLTDAKIPSVGASFADFNNDGFPDGVVTSWYGEEDLLLVNSGNGDLTIDRTSGIAPASFAESAAWADYNNDGLLDLYVANSGVQGSRNLLYRNNGEGAFDILVDDSTVQDAHLSRCVNWVDVNNDGKVDLFVTNETNAFNDLFINQGNGEFERFQNGLFGKFNFSSMTASWGDIDNDGDMDLFIGNGGRRVEENNQIYLNQGNEFVERMNGVVVKSGGCTFGSAFGDYDNDGDLDLFVSNGFCNTNLRNTLFSNNGDGTFSDSTGDLNLHSAVCSYGAAWGDINNDGFLDLMVANCKNSNSEDEQTNVMLQNTRNENNWLKVKLKGTLSNRDAIGAKARLKSRINDQPVWQMREVTSHSGYAGQNSKILHFGLGDATLVDTLIIEYPSGKKFWYKNIESNQLVEYEED